MTVADQARAADHEAADRGAPPAGSGASLPEIARRVRWLATAIVDHANRVRQGPPGPKVGGHQASSASMVEIMVSLWFSELDRFDRVSVKPHASPVLHAINYLLGDLDERYLSTLREMGGLQSYPSRLKDPDTVDFSTGSVGIGATAGIWAALAHRYARSHFGTTPPAGRFFSLVGDAELDEGAVWEAVLDPSVMGLGEVTWIVDLNRQSLDRVVPELQVQRLRGMFEAAGWQVLSVKWGRAIEEIFARPGGQALRDRLERMSNEEYQRLLRSAPQELHARIAGSDDELAGFLRTLSAGEIAASLRDLGGHDIDQLRAAYARIDDTRPTVIFAYTVKGYGLPTEGHPHNHSALLTADQMAGLAQQSGTSLLDPWASFPDGSQESALCAQRADRLRRTAVVPARATGVPRELSHAHLAPTSTQTALGRMLADLSREDPDTAARIVTCSPDVASSTNLGGWINKRRVWSVRDRVDWFGDDPDRRLRWSEGPGGQHIELGIAEVNLVSLIAELGMTWSRWGERLIPIGTIYDPFVTRALEPWSYGLYAGGQSILFGTPSGVTLAPEGGAHQSIITPSIGLEQPGCVFWEPAFAQDLEWALLSAISRVGVPGGMSAYFRLSTRVVDQSLAAVPDEPLLRERRRQHSVAGGYRLTDHGDRPDDVTLVGAGALMPEVIEAADALAQKGITAGVVCLTSPDLVFRSLDARGRPYASAASGIAEILFPPSRRAPLVTVLDGHPHTLAFLAGARGDATINLGVREFGQSSNLPDAYRLHGIDAASIVDAAMSLVGR